MNQKGPTFLIVGAARSGTTSLARYLSCHPELNVYGSEIHFFSRKFDQGLGWYHAHFDGRGLHGEKSPTYLWFKSCHERMQCTHPNAKLIAILREPVARAYSNWNYRKQCGRLTKQLKRLNARQVIAPLDQLDFASIGSFYLKQDKHSPILRKLPLDVIDRGRYGEQIAHLLKYYPREQVLVLIYERFFADVPAGLQAVHRFLGVEPIVPADVNLVRHNQSSTRPPAPEQIASSLRAFYRIQNKQLVDLLGYQIEEWDSA